MKGLIPRYMMIAVLAVIAILLYSIYVQLAEHNKILMASEERDKIYDMANAKKEAYEACEDQSNQAVDAIDGLAKTEGFPKELLEDWSAYILDPDYYTICVNDRLTEWGYLQ